MKTLTKFLLFTTALFCSTKLLAQERVIKGDMIIHITISGSGSLGNDFMNIYKRNANAEIIYTKFDSVAYAKVRKDTAYINNRMDPNRLDPQKIGKLRPIFDRHSVYDTTRVTVNLKADTIYHTILQLLTQSSKHELETSKIGERIYLDGFGFSCEIITDTAIKNINITTPMPDTHPVISSLLQESYNRLFKKTTPK